MNTSVINVERQRKLARHLRSIYWRGLGDPQRAAAEPSGPSLDAWMDVADSAFLELS